MALAILYGLYIGLWSLHKEEEKESGARTLLEVPPPSSLLSYVFHPLTLGISQALKNPG
jgi:hypothetical protein